MRTGAASELRGREMKAGELLAAVDGAKTTLDPSLEITALAYDSRRVEPGGLFFAISGEKADGHRFIRGAFERGAAGVVSEREPPAEDSSRWIRVPKIRRALAEAARKFFCFPDTKLHVFGITGTNGKTTTAYLLESVLSAAGWDPGLFGTIEYRVGTRVEPAVNTTPESLDLLARFDELVRRGSKAAVMEASSHALAQERIWGFHFAAAIFTNLTRDHLDFHKDFESYFAAKRRLFEGLGAPPPALAVINRDDPRGVRLMAESRAARTLSYGFEAGADVRASHWRQDLNGIEARVTTPSGTLEIHSPLVGRVNVMNILAAVAAAHGLGIADDVIREGVAKLRAVPGRFERIEAGQPFLVVVDYAHTDDALRNVLRTAREMTRHRLIVLFGCGGERDRTKRPLMGEAAGTLADFVVLTSDNPRSEDPILIMNDALVGLQRTGKPYVAEVDRERAVQMALEEAREGDTVVLAGKGHETYQVLKDRTIAFDDREAARRALAGMGYTRARPA